MVGVNEVSGSLAQSVQNAGRKQGRHVHDACAVAAHDVVVGKRPRVVTSHSGDAHFHDFALFDQRVQGTVHRGEGQMRIAAARPYVREHVGGCGMTAQALQGG